MSQAPRLGKAVGRPEDYGAVAVTLHSNAGIASTRLFSVTYIPEFAHLFVLKSRNETGAYKGDNGRYALLSRTNFIKNFVRVLCAVIRDFSAIRMHLNRGKRLKTNKRDSGI